MLNRLLVLAIVLSSLGTCLGQRRVDSSSFDSYLEPYVRTQNFAGAVRIEKSGKVIYEKEFGFANREKQIRNTKATHFHVASVSMQFTAAAVLRLIDSGKLSLDTHVSDIIPGISGGEQITIRDLLIQRSGLTDINSLPHYNDVLVQHQTPSSLVARIQDRPLLFEPGSKFLHEEHSAYNLLALIIEKKSGLPFAQAMKKLVFAPAHLSGTSIDDDDASALKNAAAGYQPDGVTALKPAAPIHWSAKAGNASVVTTASDEARWMQSELERDFLKENSRKLILETDPRVGYGWMRSVSDRYHQTTYYMNGRAPGFSSFVMYMPREKLSVVVFSNIYSSATTTIGYDLAAISLGLPFEVFRPSAKLAQEQIKASTGTFQFGADFYQPNAQIVMAADGADLSLRWPSGETSPLIPISADYFKDRSYWEDVTIERDSAGVAKDIRYDRFVGTRVQ